MKDYPRHLSPLSAFGMMQQENAFLLDVRSPEEFAVTHARDAAANIPHTDIAKRVNELPTDRPILAICASGNRSQMAVDTLRQLGFEKASDVEGGTRAWQAAGLPIVIFRRVIPLDQQFRLLVGLMVFIFTLLGAFVSPLFLLGSGFIGIMLALTALLGICPMLSALRKMPWNRVPESPRTIISPN